MSRTTITFSLWMTATTAVAFGFAGSRQSPKPGPVDFDRDVRPILSNTCFECHGPDEKARKASLRLDTKEGALKAAVIPGKSASSPLYLRIAAKAGAVRMPPPDFKKQLTAAQIETIRRWIDSGAAWSAHWAFVTPVKPPLPAVRLISWPRNEIDRFVLARLETERLKPSPYADRRTLIRRLALDLTGLPPAPHDVEAFVADKDPRAYENLVDRLLASPHYGERMALQWLDLARYADTHGYHIDSHRDMWRWRDWVIDAFNRNLPYDRFVIEQIAGDMLPSATLEQKIASGFNRNHPINFEGGAIPEEYHAAYIFDRIDTTATAFLGLSFRCAQCHDHKYDPFTTRDYYRMYALFNNVPEQGLDGNRGNAVPYLKAPTPEQSAELARATVLVQEAEARLAKRAEEAAPAIAEWSRMAIARNESLAPEGGLVSHLSLDETAGAGAVHGKTEWVDGRAGRALKLDGATYVAFSDGPSFDSGLPASYGAWVRPDGGDAGTVVSRMDEDASIRGWDLFLSGGRAFVHLIHHWDTNAIRVNTKQTIETGKWTHLFATYDGSGKAAGVRIYINGKQADLEITHNSLSGTIRTEKPVHLGRRNPGGFFKGAIDEFRFYDRALAPDEVERVVAAESIADDLKTPEASRTEAQIASIAAFYLRTSDPGYRQLAEELAAARRKRDEIDASIPTTMVMQEMEKPRETHMLIRGQYDKLGDRVEPGVPEVLLPLPRDAKADRMGLALWLVDPKHPLTARVAANRFWQLLFGSGLVRTPEEFGSQGERPSHPELLDWMATQFIQDGWDTKKFLKRIVMSATYRQASRVPPYLLKRDPENRLLARGPRFRLAGELIRDVALAMSGLLVPKIGGPSVRPYHPAGLWEELSINPDGEFSAQRYVQDHGEALYRRGMYTFWKRTVPPPTLLTLDAPEREFCLPRRGTTNTPLQALVLMNDPSYVEAARKFAERTLLETSPPTTRQRIAFMFRLALSREPRAAEIRALDELLKNELFTFRARPAEAEKLLAVGESPASGMLDRSELAAWTTVANAILNLDETLTKS